MPAPIIQPAASPRPSTGWSKALAIAKNTTAQMMLAVQLILSPHIL